MKRNVELGNSPGKVNSIPFMGWQWQKAKHIDVKQKKLLFCIGLLDYLSGLGSCISSSGSLSWIFNTVLDAQHLVALLTKACFS